MPLSDYAENKLNDWTLRGTTLASGQRYLALYTANPSDTGGGTECADATYARQRIDTAFPDPTGSTNGTLAINAAVEFPAATTGFTVTAVGVFDASTSGNLLRYKVLGSSIVVGAGEILRFASGQLSGTFD